MKFLALLTLASMVSAAVIPKIKRQDAMKKVIVYYQTREDEQGNYISMLGLKNKATHLLIAPFHIHEPDQPAATGDVAAAARPEAQAKVVIGGTATVGPRFDDASTFQAMWNDIKELRASGMKVMAMVGGYTDASFNKLDANFDFYYPALKNSLENFPPGLDGVDIDMEPTNGRAIQLSTITRLVKQIKSDFPGFEISMAPVKGAMIRGSRDRFTQISYEELHREVGDLIDFYAVQFYCGHGDITPQSYKQVIAGGEGTTGFVPPEKIVTGMLSIKNACPAGIVDVKGKFIPELLPELERISGGKFAGVSAWEFFGEFPNGFNKGEDWAAAMNEALNGGGSAGSESSVDADIGADEEQDQFGADQAVSGDEQASSETQEGAGTEESIGTEEGTGTEEGANTQEGAGTDTETGSETDIETNSVQQAGSEEQADSEEEPAGSHENSTETSVEGDTTSSEPDTGDEASAQAPEEGKTTSETTEGDENDNTNTRPSYPIAKPYTGLTPWGAPGLRPYTYYKRRASYRLRRRARR